MSKQTKLQHDA
jgi:hypothetical protein